LKGDSEELWALLIAFGASLFVTDQLLVHYPPFTVLSVGVITVGIAAYAVRSSEARGDWIDALVESLVRNVEAVFYYYESENFYRIFVPSSMGRNGMLLLNKYPVELREIRSPFINRFQDEGVGVLLETPGTVVVERLRGKISFTEDVEFILRKGMTESFNFSKGVKASWEGEDTMVVQIERPNPNRPLKLIGYIPSLVAASLISERLSRPVFIEDQELKGDVLTLRIGLA
jgi:hypothetical protein